MRRCLIGSLAVLFMAISVVPVDAHGFRGRTIVRSRCWFSKTITTTVYTADLAPSRNNFGNAAGTATYTVTEIDLTIWGQTWTSTCVTLSISATGLTSVNNSGLEDGDTVSFYDTDGDLLGDAVIASAAASLDLSSKAGDTIPDLSASGIYVVKTNGNGNHILDGDFIETNQTVTGCGTSGGSGGSQPPPPPPPA